MSILAGSLGTCLRSSLGAAGSLVLLTAYPLYLLGALASSQVSPVRAIGLFAVLGLGYVAGGAVLAGLAAALHLAEHRRAQDLVQGAVVAGAYLNLVAVGLAVWFGAAPLAPLLARTGALAIVAVLMYQYLRSGPADRTFVAGGLLRLGLAPLGLLAACGPWVAYAALIDRPQIAGRPELSTAPALREGRPRRIVLVTFDALRARSTSLHPSSPDATPHLAGLAREGASYTAMRASSDHTAFAMPVVHSGMHPTRLFAHVGHRSGALREQSFTGLAGFLRQAGYRSYYATMLIDPSVISLGSEFEAGSYLVRFTKSRDFNTTSFLPLEPAGRWLIGKLTRRPNPPEMSDVLQATRRTFETARAYLERSDERSFVWVHLAPPHSPYVDVRQPVLDDPRMARYRALMHNPNGGAAYQAACEGAYNSYVRFADAELGRFVRGLREAGLARDTLLVVTADHGEEFQPGIEPHGNGLANEDVTRVPFVINGPGVPQGLRVDTPAGHVDVLPTLLSAVYRELPAGLDGVSLFAPPAPGRTVFTWALVGLRIERDLAFGNVAAYQRDLKYLRTLPSGRERLFDLTADPGGLQDVAEERPAETARLRREVDRFLAPP